METPQTTESDRVTYAVAGWAVNFENADTRKLKSLGWVRVSNRLDSLGYRRLAAQEDRCELLSAWLLILEVSSRGPVGQRGRLIRDGVALTAEDLELITGFPASIFERAFEFFVGDAMGWLIAETASPESSEDLPGATGDSPNSSGDRPDAPGKPPAEGKNEQKDGERGKKRRLNKSRSREIGSRRDLSKPAPPLKGLSSVRADSNESQQAWLARLQAEFPKIDVTEQLCRAIDSQHRKGRKLEREWFVEVWLKSSGLSPGASEIVEDPRSLRKPLPAIASPTDREPAVFSDALRAKGWEKPKLAS